MDTANMKLASELAATLKEIRGDIRKHGIASYDRGPTLGRKHAELVIETPALLRCARYFRGDRDGLIKDLADVMRLYMLSCERAIAADLEALGVGCTEPTPEFEYQKQPAAPTLMLSRPIPGAAPQNQ